MMWLIVAITVALDQLTKLGARSWGWSTLNPGISFGWFHQLPSTWLILILAGIGLGLSFKLARITSISPVIRGLFIGGLISNLLDRIFLGGVVDWIPVPFVGLSNNLADYAIALSVVWLASKHIHE
jgi:lipoprotein signal peptidase